MEKIKQIFTELLNGKFLIDSEVSISLLYTAINSLYSRERSSLYIYPA